jgi:tungstate transport system substrate-binding protein
MRRPFIVMEANPKKFPDANFTGAQALYDFLLSPKVQSCLLTFGRFGTSTQPLFFPVNGDSQILRAP